MRIKLFIIIPFFIFAALSTSGIIIFNSVLKAENHKKAGNINYDEKGIIDKKTEDSRNIVYEPVNIAVFGLDEENIRTDVVMVVNFDPNDGKIEIISVPRDTKVYIDDHINKINAVIPIKGKNPMLKILEEITGKKIKYYIIFNLKGFKDTIDCLGGVYFNVPFKMDYDDPDQDLHIHLDEGMQLLDGEKCEQLVRYRKNNRSGGYENGDIGRVEMQQDFLRQLISQKVNLYYVSKINDIYNIIINNIETNIKISDVSLYTNDLSKINAAKIKSFVIPGKPDIINGVWYYIFDPE